MKHSHLPPLPYSGAAPDTALLQPAAPVLLPLPEEEPLDLHHTFRCGQVFRWRQHDEWWYGPYREGSLAMRRVPEGVEVRALGTTPTAGEVWRFLGLDHPLREIYRQLEADPWIARAIRAAAGMRVLRQDPWECLCGYVCSQNSNIPKIELSTERVARNWGLVHRWDTGVEVASFPSPEALAQVTPEELRQTALGYRSEYLAATTRRVVTEGLDLYRLRSGAYEDALAQLLRFTGIGRKVADCILLFSLDRPEACPVDVWVRRVIHELYPQPLQRYLPDAAERMEKALTPREYEAIFRFSRDRWGRLAGYAQQYLFYTRRNGLLEKEG